MRIMQGFCLFLFILLVSSPTWPQTDEPQVLPIDETPVVVIREDGSRHSFETELAVTSEQQAIGMMFRDAYPDTRGMLFPFRRLRIASFWMKNCLIPLDMVFVRRNGTIANIAAMTEPMTLTGYRSKGHVIAVFEVRGGLMAELGIKAGDKLYHPSIGLLPPAP